ncbi:ChiQ/YbfN family lipoprotein [Pragia fontium]|uniref:Lipoprotein n=1 Tax=Pragia fontium TaxID=82985 RepID=A0ABQ5LJ61_9GAMM|nr:ChiQ/YbfN family lipoprotein [Pragia fontium]AKJ41448.1 hypothetical protein QQ39_04610 [Pragia fontium]GKX63011.1 lipoprotein [Pragia fontium]SUB81711.1 Uncharacterised protein [Pragia fontium]VEJ54244.1 Uncharacterised protein [Pragia fontium]
MKKLLLIVAMTVGLSACASQSENTQEESDLKQAYSNCIKTAEGSVEKVQACQSILAVLKQDEKHQAFAEKETVRVLDYQNCIQAAETGNGQAYAKQCGKIWQEIRANNE